MSKYLVLIANYDGRSHNYFFFDNVLEAEKWVAYDIDETFLDFDENYYSNKFSGYEGAIVDNTSDEPVIAWEIIKIEGDNKK